MDTGLFTSPCSFDANLDFTRLYWHIGTLARSVSSAKQCLGTLTHQRRSSINEAGVELHQISPRR